MENATKALMMAGGVLLTLLVISLLIYAWGVFSDYYSNDADLTEIEDLTEFNLQFTNYDRDDVMGYEIISLANRVIDYNERFSTVDGNDSYSPIKLTVNFAGNNMLFAYDDENLLFTSDSLSIDETSGYLINTFETIFETVDATKSIVGTEEAATNIIKSYSSIILTNDQIEYNKNSYGMTEDESKLNALNTFNSLSKGETYSDYEEMKTAVTTDYILLKYYEYYQFKKGIFECTLIEYDDTTGRVNNIEFTFTGEIE